MKFDKNNIVIYVVDIPQSNIAHQAFDKRYYKRFNFISTPMEDYEIRDINKGVINNSLDLYRLLQWLHWHYIPNV